jgi:uncharacterized membrane protein YkoI
MQSRPPLLLLACCLALASLCAPAFGKDKDRKAQERAAKQQAQQEALAALQRGEILPLARIMQIATTRVPGDIIEIEYKAGPKYEVKILTPEGRIKEVKLDARTGEITKIEDK